MGPCGTTQPPVPLRCDDDFSSPAVPLPPLQTNSDGEPYRVVQIPSDTIDPLYAVVFLPQTLPAYDAGAPVVVSPHARVRPW